MERVALVVFWISLAVLAYTYAGYPVLLWAVRALRRGRRSGRTGESPDIQGSSGLQSTRGSQPCGAGGSAGRRTAAAREQELPRATLVIAAYNEEAVIAEKLENALALDYPDGALEIIVSSDGSTDRTNEIVDGYADRGVRLVAVPEEERRGQCVAFERGLAAATGEVVFFSDSTGMYNAEALARMARHFADEKVGCVGGEIRYVSGDSVVGEGTGAYWRYERIIKRLQSDAFSNTTISGAIFGLRRDLYPSVPAETGSDMIVPMSIVSGGYRVVYEPGAVASEATTESARDELRMRVRIPVRGFASMAYGWRAMNPLRHPVVFLNVVSHKALRWLAGLFMILLLGSNVVLVRVGGFYLVFLAVQLLFYAGAGIGYLLRDKKKTLFNIPYYFCLLNFSALAGFVQFLFGKRIARWEPAR
ncbi:MAG: glycosyltransferase family 2 protein [Actinobacteria bacterium]|nr:MAG: glycosyltransferase family 2 protein [Actinomycetota bacterium]